MKVMADFVKQHASKNDCRDIAEVLFSQRLDEPFHGAAHPTRSDIRLIVFANRYHCAVRHIAEESLTFHRHVREQSSNYTGCNTRNSTTKTPSSITHLAAIF